ncbi:MAG: ATPase inhibitor subunit zeta [Pseudomonadota bacterium]
MTLFDGREQAFEMKYANDTEKQFRALARRARLLGDWAAKQLGKTGDAAKAYSREVVIAHLDDTDSACVTQKLLADLEGLATPETIHAKVAEYRREARKRPRATD